MDCSLPGSSVHGIFQARVLEWDAIAFSMNFLLIIIYIGGSVTYLVIARNNNLVKPANTNNIAGSIIKVIHEN